MNLSDNGKYHIALILLVIIVFSAAGYYIGSQNKDTALNTTQISSQIGEPDYINLANSGKGISSGGTPVKKNTTNKTNGTKT